MTKSVLLKQMIEAVVKVAGNWNIDGIAITVCDSDKNVSTMIACVDDLAEEAILTAMVKSAKTKPETVGLLMDGKPLDIVKE